MKNSFSKIIITLVVVAAVVGLVFVIAGGSKTNNIEKTALDDFAQCISDAGATFYGAFWCPHCQDQKTAFKNSKNLPYIECSTANRQQTAECRDAGITGYPTWEFADGTRESGVVSLEELAELTDCPLPTPTEE